MSIEERVNAIDAQAPSTSASGFASAGTKKTPKTDSLATLLEQGLQSRDKNILNVRVFYTRITAVIWIVEFVVLCIHRV